MKKKNIMYREVIVMLTAGMMCSGLNAVEKIAADDPNIHYEGIKIVAKEADGGMRYKRFTDEIYNITPPNKKKGDTVPSRKAQTTPCVKMLFKTKSKKIKLFFKTLPEYEHRGASFGIYQNGKWWKSIDFNKDHRDMELNITPETPGKEVLYTIALPSWSNPFFYGMELDDGASLIPFTPVKRKIYVAYGDSVSHGTGQKGSYQTWPYKLAEKINYEVYSLAVGGASIKLPVIEMFGQFDHIDLITVYIGINDAARKSIEQYKKDYDEMLSIIRKYHSKTKIVCITMHTVPEDKVGRFSKVRLIDYRKPVIEIVTARRKEGDGNLFLVHGDQLTTLKDAMNPGNVHLSIEGADKWAEKLYQKIKDKL